MDLDFLKERIRDAEEKDRVAEAVELLRGYLTLDPANSHLGYTYGQNLRVLGRLSEAEAVLTALDLSSVPEKKRYLIHLNLAQIYEARGEFIRSEAMYRLAAEESPESTVPWVFLAVFLLNSERVNDAKAALARGLQASGDLDEVHHNLGNCYRAEGNLEAAMKEYQKAINLDPTDATSLAKLEDVIAAAVAREELRAQ